MIVRILPGDLKTADQGPQLYYNGEIFLITPHSQIEQIADFSFSDDCLKRGHGTGLIPIGGDDDIAFAKPGSSGG